MVDIREILVDWVGAGGVSGVSVMHFGALSNTPASQRAALSTFLTALRPSLAASTNYRIRPEGRELDEATGTLTGVWSEPTLYANSGTSAASGPVPNAAQILVRWATPAIINGRVLKGRTFIPGAANTASGSSGEVVSGVVTSFTAAGAALIIADVDLRVWSRPKPGRPGQAFTVTGVNVWSELAVQRRRRT